MYKLYDRLKKSLKIRLDKLRDKVFKNEFRKRIEKRKSLFWEDPKQPQDIYKRLHASDPVETWHNFPDWQRLLGNKLNAKEFAKKFGSRIANLYWSGGKEEFQNFDLKVLPENFIIKPVFGATSKNVFVMKGNQNLFDGKEYTLVELTSQIKSLFGSKPDLKLIIEEFIPNKNNEYVAQEDYKFFMFNGHVTCIRLIKKVGKKKSHNSFYTGDWKLIEKKIQFDASINCYEEPPKNLHKMIQDAKRLSRIYKNFVRIDFYDSSDGPVFGENLLLHQGEGENIPAMVVNF